MPKHIAIIMDGNGRWAKKRFMPRIAGHIRGVKRVREIVEHCADLNVEYLTLFAFGRENWRRPKDEVSFLMKLLYEQLDKELLKLHQNGICVRFVGDRSRLDALITQKIKDLEQLTINNQRLKLNIALDYSGTYDLTQAVNKLLVKKSALGASNSLVTEEELARELLFYPHPNPDLLIRTSGEARLSNFMLWQLAYSECYFVNTLWPDFSKSELNKAVEWFKKRERRFGMISEQLSETPALDEPNL